MAKSRRRSSPAGTLFALALCGMVAVLLLNTRPLPVCPEVEPLRLLMFVPDSVLYLGRPNVVILEGEYLYLRDSFDPETVRPVGAVFEIRAK